MRKRAFTLIELLVVVAIIAVLIAILLPSLGRAKANAVRVKCGALLRQWGSAVAMYAQENQDWFGVEWQEANGGPKHFWNTISVGSATIYDSEWSAATAQGTKISQEFRTCPGDPEFGKVAAAGSGASSVLTTGTRPPVDYAMVRYTPVTSNQLMWRTTQFNHPNSTVLITDSPTNVYGQGTSTMKSYYSFTTLADLNSEPVSLDESLKLRHLGIGNVAFMDGHVEQHTYQDFVNNIPASTVSGGGGTYVPPATESGKMWTSITTP